MASKRQGFKGPANTRHGNGGVRNPFDDGAQGEQPDSPLAPPAVEETQSESSEPTSPPPTEKPSEAGDVASPAQADGSDAMAEPMKWNWGSRPLLFGAALAALTLIGILVWSVISGLASKETAAVLRPAESPQQTTEQKQIADLKEAVLALQSKQVADGEKIKKLGEEVARLSASVGQLTEALTKQQEAVRPSVTKTVAKAPAKKRVATVTHKPAKQPAKPFAHNKRAAARHATTAAYQRGLAWHQRHAGHHGHGAGTFQFRVTSKVHTAELVCKAAYSKAKNGECSRLLPAMLGAIGAEKTGTDIYVGWQTFPSLKTLRRLAGVHRQGAP